jgi:hypothetical protein
MSSLRKTPRGRSFGDPRISRVAAKLTLSDFATDDDGPCLGVIPIRATLFDDGQLKEVEGGLKRW